MNTGYNHTIPGVQEPIISLALANTTIACTDATLTINEDVSNIVEAGVIGYKNAITNPDFTTADDVVVFGSYVQGDTVQTSIDLSLLSYESITDTSTKTFYAYGYVKYSDGTYKYSNMVSDVFAPNTLSDALDLRFDGKTPQAIDVSGSGNDGNVVGATHNGLTGSDAGWIFDRQGDYITTPYDPVNEFTRSIDVEFGDYAKYGTSYSDSNMYIFDNQSSPSNRYLAYYDSSDDSIIVYAAGVEVINYGGISTDYPSGTRMSISFATESGINKLTINGVVVQETSIARNSSNQGSNMTFGRRFTSEEYFEGVLYEAKFRGRALSNCEAILLGRISNES